eukprot:6468081-Amphidinium_carterae.1
MMAPWGGLVKKGIFSGKAAALSREHVPLSASSTGTTCSQQRANSLAFLSHTDQGMPLESAQKYTGSRNPTNILHAYLIVLVSFSFWSAAVVTGSATREHVACNDILYLTNYITLTQP